MVLPPGRVGMPPGGGILMGERWEPFGVLKGAACVRTDCPFTAALESFALKCWFVRTLAAGATKIETAFRRSGGTAEYLEAVSPLGRIAVPHRGVGGTGAAVFGKQRA